ncbi:MAG: hypothetical protein C7B46_15095 [Sulfobacillus benefaciens]|uniref:Carbohydrate kinase PfkB domain-containing protein n=1 Tax=Sulfobacillus benefaciens TaxID=453960 RepID=A0A2T2XCR9_9FIRM|nr:MAG: hypothetical protein C7B46_15095 [Sulfobacillus benefaciens]
MVNPERNHAMIWCVTLNPALDVTYRLDTPIQSGAIYRAKPIPRAGGKGNNVARAVATLGLAVTAVGIYGGMTGTVIRQLLAEDGIGCVYQETPMETRRCMTFTAGSHVAEVREPGAYIPVEDGATLLDMVQSRVASTDWVTLSGSLPSDWPPDTYAVWVDTLKPRVAGILVDTAGLPSE